MKHRLPPMLLVVVAVALAGVRPAAGQAADPTLAGRPPDDVTDRRRCSPSSSTRRR